MCFLHLWNIIVIFFVLIKIMHVNLLMDRCLIILYIYFKIKLYTVGYVIYKYLSFVIPLNLGFYRGVTPGITGSLATGATYFGVIESTKKWIEESHPSLGGHWAHFIAGAVGKLIQSSCYFCIILSSGSCIFCKTH